MIIWIFGSYAFLKTIIKYSSCLSFYLSFSYWFSRRSFRLWSFLRNSYITGIFEVHIFIITIIIECLVILVMLFVHSKVWCIAMQRFKIKILQIKRIIVMKVTRLGWHCSAWEGVFYFSKLRLMLKLVSSIRPGSPPSWSWCSSSGESWGLCDRKALHFSSQAVVRI